MARWAPLRTDVLDEYAVEVLQVFPRGRLLVGVDGLDGAGKTTFAADLVAAFGRRDVPAATVSLDDFHTPREVRHAAPDDGAVWYRQAYDLEAFRRLVVAPYRRGEAVALRFRSAETDAVVDDPPTWTPPERAVLVVEGLYLHRPELVGLWHTTAWLETDVETGIARCEARDADKPSWRPDVPERIRQAADRYFREVDPRKRAVASFDLHDPAHPRRIFSDSC